MPVIFHEASREFHLYNEEISYIFTVLKNGQLGQLYFGKRLRDQKSFSHLLECRRRTMAVCPFPEDRDFSLEHIRQEYPSYGTGDMRLPAFEILQKDGSRISDFTYFSHEIKKGKPALCGLPATYVEEEDEAETLLITLRDEWMQAELVLSYTIFQEFPAIARNAAFVCHNPEGITLNGALSMNLDLPDSRFEFVSLCGAWARERHIKTSPLHQGVQEVYSLRGASSSSFNPFFALKRPEATEWAGDVYGFSLVYSGNFLARVDVDTFSVCRAAMGIHPQEFCWPLSEGETFQTPEAVLVFSDGGLGKMSQTYHTLYQTRLARGFWRDRERPILINNWEATYFDFTEDALLNIAKTAKGLGIELFVLDDGWFGSRDSSKSSLGDWTANRRKLPGGIRGIAEKITALGLRFGLWFEPEMVNPDSDLYRAHPDWILQTPGRRASHGRNQYVLDFSREDVVSYIYQQMEAVLSGAPVSYVKWDMNRILSEVYSCALPPERQGMVFHRYILGVYSLYEKLTARFPEILFESCASGGARFDPGMLYYAPQCWTSDDTDAVERLKIQYGTSLVYPLSCMGAHVSAVPNHQALRITPLVTRGNVAAFGVFGYELDLNRLSAEELETVRKQVAFVKKYRELIHKGDFYRLASPFEGDGNVTAWMVVGKDKKQALVGYYRLLEPVNGPYQKLPLLGLAPEKKYHVSILDTEQYGDELMYAGLIVSDASSGENKEAYNGANGDFQSRIYCLTAEDL